MTNKILYTSFYDYNSIDFSNVEPIHITADELLQEILKYKDGTIYLGKIIVEGDFDCLDETFEGYFSCGQATFEGYFFCGEATFKGDFFCGEATFEGDFFCGEATFERDFFCGEATFKRYFYGDRATFEGDFFCGEATFERDFFCGEATFKGDFFCGEATFKGDFFCGEATFEGDFFCDPTTFKGYFSFGKATFEGGKPNIPSGVKQKKTEEITNKNIDNAKLDSVVGLININTLQELVYAEVAMMEYDGDIHPAVYGHRLLLKAFFKAGDIPAKFYEIIRSKLNDNKTWSFILARIFTELKSELINYD